MILDGYKSSIIEMTRIDYCTGFRRIRHELVSAEVSEYLFLSESLYHVLPYRGYLYMFPPVLSRQFTGITIQIQIQDFVLLVRTRLFGIVLPEYGLVKNLRKVLSDYSTKRCHGRWIQLRQTSCR